MQRRLFVLGNWKLNHTVAQARAFFSELTPLLLRSPVEVVVAPPATALAALAAEGAAQIAALCAQDAHEVDAGAFTGALSAPLLRDAGASWLLAGHSERRVQFGESDELVARKVAAGHRATLGIVLCVGEAASAEHDAAAALAQVQAQVLGGLSLLDAPPQQLVIAYEPAWAIGTSRSAEPAKVAKLHAHIRALLETKFGAAHAAQVRVVYGGGVQPEAVGALLHQREIDGLLVGKASLSASSFARIVGLMHEARANR